MVFLSSQTLFVPKRCSALEAAASWLPPQTPPGNSLVISVISPFFKDFFGTVQSFHILSSRKGIKTYCSNRTRESVCNTQRSYPLHLHGLTAFKPFKGQHFKDWLSSGVESWVALAASFFMISFPPDFLGAWKFSKERERDWGGLQEKCDAD